MTRLRSLGAFDVSNRRSFTVADVLSTILGAAVTSVTFKSAVSPPVKVSVTDALARISGPPSALMRLLRPTVILEGGAFPGGRQTLAPHGEAWDLGFIPPVAVVVIIFAVGVGVGLAFSRK